VEFFPKLSFSEIACNQLYQKSGEKKSLTLGTFMKKKRFLIFLFSLFPNKCVLSKQRGGNISSLCFQTNVHYFLGDFFCYYFLAFCHQFIF